MTKHILDLLEAGSGSARATFKPMGAGEQNTTFAEIWERSGEIASLFHADRWLRRVAALLTPDANLVAAMVGCLRAGKDFVSLPLPSRGLAHEAYVGQLRHLLQTMEAEVLVASEALVPMLAPHLVPFGIRVLSGEQLTTSARSLGAPGVDWEAGRLFQFSSGRTGAPKGVELSGEALGASVTATLDRLEVSERDVSCQWVPLSHDMGLVGGLFGSWVGQFARYVCSSPERFIVRPRSWMEDISEHRATITMAPTFGYALCSRTLDAGPALDLGCLRACIVGAEPVTSEALTAFGAAGARHGFSPLAICPAYGLAEASLAVSMVRPGDGWTSRRVRVDGEIKEYVACGPPLRCIEVRVPSGAIGAIELRGSALCSSLIPSCSRLVDGWLDTGDVGTSVDGDLVVVGRADDLLFVLGKKVFAWELERHLEQIPGVRRGSGAAVSSGDAGYAIVFEPAADSDSNFARLVDTVRRDLVAAVGAGPSRVCCIPRGTLPKTPSGKIRRPVIGRMLDELSSTSLASKEYRA